MAKPIVVLMNWDHIRTLEMASLAHNVSVQLRRNETTFSSPAVAPDELDHIATQLELAYANRKNGPEAKTAYETADKKTDDLLHTEAAYVNGVARGDAAIIQSAGFTATSSTRKSSVVPATPELPKISGNAAELHLQIPAVDGATNYCWVIFSGNGISATVSDTHITVTGACTILPDGTAREVLRNIVPAGTTITVQVLAQNAAGKSGFTQPVSFTVGS